MKLPNEFDLGDGYKSLLKIVISERKSNEKEKIDDMELWGSGVWCTLLNFQGSLNDAETSFIKSLFMNANIVDRKDIRTITDSRWQNLIFKYVKDNLKRYGGLKMSTLNKFRETPGNVPELRQRLQTLRDLDNFLKEYPAKKLYSLNPEEIKKLIGDIDGAGKISGFRATKITLLLHHMELAKEWAPMSKITEKFIEDFDNRFGFRNNSGATERQDHSYWTINDYIRKQITKYVQEKIPEATQKDVEHTFWIVYYTRAILRNKKILPTHIADFIGVENISRSDFIQAIQDLDRDDPILLKFKTYIGNV